MSAGYIVIPLADDSVDQELLRELAAAMQRSLVVNVFGAIETPVVSHFVEYSPLVERLTKYLAETGHAFPGCGACP